MRLDIVDFTAELVFEGYADVTERKLLPWMWLRSALQRIVAGYLEVT